MDRKKAFWLSRILAGVCIVSVVASFYLQRGTWQHIGLLVIAVAAMMTATTILSTYYRCPHCDTKLEPWGKMQKTCPKCGKKL